MTDQWESLPRMFYELCDGHPGTALEVYALDHPKAGRLWLCQSCWLERWHELRRRVAES